MIESTVGVILRTRPLTETSLIAHWLTPDLGRLATVAKGARRPRSPFAGKLDLFYEADLTFHRSRRSELHTLREVTLRALHPALRDNIAYLRQASYAVALIEQTTETETPLPGLFQLFTGFLAHLPLQPPQHRTVCAFELKLLDALGLRPDPSRHALSPATRQLANFLADSDWPDLASVTATPAQVRELRQFLRGFMANHLAQLPPTPPM